MARVDPPFRADQVGSLLRSPDVLDARTKAAAGDDHGGRAPGRRGRRHRQERRRAREHRHAQHHRRRAAAGLVPPRLPPAAGGRGGHRQHRVELGLGGHRAHDTAQAVGGRAAPPRAGHPGGRLPLPRVRHDADTEGVHPVTDDGPLPRRAGRHRPAGVPEPRPVLRRPRRLLPGRDRRAVRRRLPVPPARRHEPGLPVRSGDAGRRGRAGRRPRRAASRVRRADQPGPRVDDPPI